MTSEMLWKLRKEIILNSLFIADYRNTFGIDPHVVCNFFDSYLSYLDEEMKLTIPGYDDAHFFDHLPDFDTEDVYGKIKVMQKVIYEQDVNERKNMQRVSFLPLFTHQRTGKHLSTMCVSTGKALVVDRGFPCPLSLRQGKKGKTIHYRCIFIGALLLTSRDRMHQF